MYTASFTLFQVSERASVSSQSLLDTPCILQAKTFDVQVRAACRSMYGQRIGVAALVLIF